MIPDESELVKGIKNKNQEIFRIFVEKWQQQIINICFGFTNDIEEAKDLAQDVFIEVCNSIDKFRGDCQLSTWLYRIAVNKSINYIKKKKRINFLRLYFYDNYEENDDRYVSVNDKSEDTSNEYIEQKERIKILNQAMASLPEKQRIAFTLHKINDIPYKNIADIMKLSIPSVESLIHRAKINLQKKLLSYYKNKF